MELSKIKILAHEYGHHLDHKQRGFTNEAFATRRANNLRCRYGRYLRIEFMKSRWYGTYYYPEDYYEY